MDVVGYPVISITNGQSYNRIRLVRIGCVCVARNRYPAQDLATLVQFHAARVLRKHSRELYGHTSI